ncbi:alpha-1,2-fucosyltransferase [Haloferula sp. A504]|uniref:alpha-1,2-fucosyltransferase n=1 Tax=Haloferula sp. A504 TaxID=3373601 RepID=UPI0031C74871|nr:alpha-1,2-fucosyltransferase [Verrucomicrobiaceae bacterium E54]
MIRIIMRGRTGNNLFQYALGRVLSQRHASRLVLDGSLFQPSDWEVASRIRDLPLRAELRRGLSLPSRAVRKFTGKHPWELLGIPVIREPGDDTSFNPAFLDAPAHCVISGFFQSPRYFSSIEDDLRRELDLSTLAWPESTREQARMLADSETVAVHVRRTDYVGRDVFDLCGLDYYRTCISRMRDSLSRPRFFVFSDDPAWCADNFRGDDIAIMPPPDDPKDPLHDLHLMSCARHHVIANSSYSWWAAWLGKHPRQKVLAPGRWFGGSEIHAPMHDRLGQGWETVEV